MSHAQEYSDHYRMVVEFMKLAGQRVRTTPLLPTDPERYLRAKLILEEAVETIEALGYDIVGEDGNGDPLRFGIKDLSLVGTVVEGREDGNLVEIVDGCADLSVVLTGTLAACGVRDLPVLTLVDANNLAKFGPGSWVREDGKLMKPPGHRPPDLGEELARQAGLRP